MHDNLYQKKLDFLREYEFFKYAGQQTRNLIFCFQNKCFQRGDFIYKQGDQTQNFYLIQEGEIEVS